MLQVAVPLGPYAGSAENERGLFQVTENTVISSSEVNENFDILGDPAGTCEKAVYVDDDGNVGSG